MMEGNRWLIGSRVSLYLGALLLAAGLLPVVLSTSPAHGAPLGQATWTEGNGHTYVVVGFTSYWDEARVDLVTSLPGYDMATITSQAEQDFVTDLVNSVGNGGDYWLGAYQDPPTEPDPTAGWTWVTAEPWSYTNWRGGEPNDGGRPGDEQYVTLEPGGWNDCCSVVQEVRAFGYIAETLDLPASATCDGHAATHIGNAGHNLLIGTSGADVIVGRGGADIIDGGGGDDTICAGTGDDVIVGGLGNDLILGQQGSDTVVYSSAPASVSVNLQLKQATGGHGTDTIENIEHIVGSAFDDTLRGNAKRNIIHGGDGNDRIQGLGGNDDLYGQSGDDKLNGRRGDDLLTGGPGVDQVMFIHAPGGVTVDLLAGTATGDGNDTLDGIENVFGSRFADTLSGDGQTNVIKGSKGGDDLFGRGGDDELIGNKGTDTGDGGAGTDICRTETKINCE